MKQCPTCGSRYTDDTFVYCLQDGATLQAEGDPTNPLNLIATLRDDSVEAHEEQTVMTHISSAPTIKINAPALPTTDYQEARPTAERATSADAPLAEIPTKPARLVVITVIVTVLLLGLGGIGAWFFFRGHGDGGGRERRAAGANANALASDNEDGANAPQSTNGSRADRPDKGGRWFVILATFSKDDLSRANERLEVIRRQGFDARIVSSDDYPNMQSGQWVIVIGPFTRNNAEEVLSKVRPKIKDAYTKSGW